MMGLATRLGSVINISIVKELGPVLAATMLAGRVGSSMAAELGTMRVTEQIDALTALGTNPIYYLVVPRFLACLLLIPLLTLMADFMGVIGGAVVATQILTVDSFAYWKHSRDFVESLDIFAGVFKSYFFGAAIALISCHRGFNSRPGPRAWARPRPRRSSSRSSPSSSSISCSGWAGTPCTDRSGPRPKGCYERWALPISEAAKVI